MNFIEAKGKYNTAKIFNPSVDGASYGQVVEMMNREEFKDSKIRFMPDIHYGKGATVGTTMTLTGQVVPNFIGVDIGCGVSVTKLSITKDEALKDGFLKQLDKDIRKAVPLGFKRHDVPKTSKVKLEDFLVKDSIKEDAFYQSIGTLGGGNHFISLEANDAGEVYLLIHSGSRSVGLTVATTYQELADAATPEARKGEGIVSGDLYERYLHDLKLAQAYALQNRNAMRDVILTAGKMEALSTFDTVHNYIDTDAQIARKGAISAKLGEMLVIPFNSRDGSVIAVGKGNDDWNQSAPHGAGRTMSRGQAKKLITLDEYKEMMTDIYSSSVSTQTVDEAPTAYKNFKDILTYAQPTIDVKEWIKPIYNLKG